MQNQHFVPKFLLRNFADADGKVFRFDKTTNVVSKVPPKYAASLGNFYEFEVHGRQVSFETRFQNIETKAAPCFRKIVESNSLANLTSYDRTQIANFISAQAFRTQAFLHNLVGKPDRTVVGETLEQLWESSFLTIDFIVRRQWILLEASDGEAFYLGDQPVVLQHTEDPSGVRHLGFDILGVEAYLPVSPKLAINMLCPSISSQILSAFKNGQGMSEALWKSGRGSTPEAFSIQRKIANIRPLAEGILSGSKIPCAPETILNFNYLQCAWSHQWLFSNNRNFEIAEMILSKSPQYRNAPSTGVANIFQAGVSPKWD